MGNRSAVIFDLDGTLTRPFLDFDAIRGEIGISGGPILEAVAEMGPESRARAEAILLRHEWEAAVHSTLQDSAAEVLAALRTRGHPVAIFTRNARPTVDYILQQHGLWVDAVRTREDGAFKPSPEPVQALCRTLNADPARSWVVGDFLFDILSGRAAGARTVLMIGEAEPPPFSTEADFVIRRLPELLPIIDSAARARYGGPVDPGALFGVE
jgi:HAD superfamily hydrolase (TIGR01509 family)